MQNIIVMLEEVCKLMKIKQGITDVFSNSLDPSNPVAGFFRSYFT